jgi:hypothetical protein
MMLLNVHFGNEAAKHCLAPLLQYMMQCIFYVSPAVPESIEACRRIAPIQKETRPQPADHKAPADGDIILESLESPL